MCARRFLIIVFLATLLFAAGAFAIYQFGSRVLLRQATPQGEFKAPPVGSGPDYAGDGAWIAKPSFRDDPSRWRPDASADAAARPAVRAAAFYIHPTTYLQRDRWNAPLGGNTDSDFRAQLFVRSQASAFNSVADVWAPRYRQAAYGAFLLQSDNAQKALDLAYSDVVRAFDHFLRGIGPNEPIVLAGHSQGALHLSRLLVDRKAKLGGRLVAAYVVGWPLSVTADLPATGLVPCEAPNQAGCILSWLTFAEPANPDLILDAWRGSRGPSGAERRRQDMLCVNPISGTRDGSAPPAANAGTLAPSADLARATLLPGRVGAHCDKGILIVNGEIPPLRPYVLPGNNYHVYDYALFWGAIRQDVERRLASWRR